MKIIALILLLMTGSAQAGPAPADRTAEAIEALASAASILDRAGTPEERVQALTMAVAAHEKALSALRAGSRDLVRAETSLRAELDAGRNRIARLTGILITMRRLEDGAAMLHPGGVLARTQAALILESVTPDLNAQSALLRTNLADLQILRQAHDDAGVAARAGLVRLRWARQELTTALKSGETTREMTPALRDALAALTATSSSLDLLTEGLAALNPPIVPLPESDMAAQFGKLPLPAEGRLVSTFGEAPVNGERQWGGMIATTPGALVTTPADATIRYLGPFLGYGNVIILEPSPDILLVLAGMKEVYGGPDQIVRAGVAVGIMGGNADDEAAGELTEALYVEIRRGGSPVDPAGWFLRQEE